MLDARPYQDTGADFLAERLYALLGDDAGLGKSRTTIMAMDRLGLKRRLIICPAIARTTWPAEIEKWSTSTAPVYVIDPTTPTAAVEKLFYPQAVTIIVAFDTISNDRNHPKLLAYIHRSAWDVVIIDEGHRLATPGSNRTSRIYGPRLDRKKSLIEHANRVWVLTGTPTPNHAGEIYTHARALFPDAIGVLQAGGAVRRPMEQHEFIERYCRYRDTQWGRQITGSQNQDELRQRLGPHILRRRKQDVLKELPPMDFVAVPVPVSSLVIPDSWDEMRVPVTLPIGDELLAFLASRATQLATLRRELGMAKLEASVEYIMDLLESGVRKVVVFAHHRDLINAVAGALAEFNPVVITGDTSEPQRRQAIIKFQNNPDTRVFVGQIDACGVAITLTAAHDVVFIECSWVPGANYQAASRCHRLGQRDGVLARMLYVPGTVDERIMKTFQRKANEIAQLWD